MLRRLHLFEVTEGSSNLRKDFSVTHRMEAPYREQPFPSHIFDHVDPLRFKAVDCHNPSSPLSTFGSVSEELESRLVQEHKTSPSTLHPTPIEQFPEP